MDEKHTLIIDSKKFEISKEIKDKILAMFTSPVDEDIIIEIEETKGIEIKNKEEEKENEDEE